MEPIESQPPERIENETEITVNTWDEMDLNVDLLRGVYAYGFEKPSPIQSKACLPIIQGKDLLAQAQSGTGKTGTFVIGSLSRINTDIPKTQVLILSPTRELAVQTMNVIVGIGCMMNKLTSKLLVGGADDNVYEMRHNPPHIIAGTPGRVYDMCARDYIIATDINLVVLDEADELLSFGFKDQMFDIFQCFQKDIQVALFSATLSQNIINVSKNILKDPLHIVMKTEQLVLDGIAQYYVTVEDDKQKFSTLQDLFERLVLSQTIIYCNSVSRVIDLYEAMKKDSFPVCCIHSNMDKYERKNAFEEFKAGKYRVLISSNVTARGIDIQQVSIVINFDLPKDPHTYLHRIGRSGRWGRKGIGINFVTRRDLFNVESIETYFNKEMEELPMNFEKVLN
jgi:superfamily II DNA/RNA helicase